jgi:hypothetical protein
LLWNSTHESKVSIGARHGTETFTLVFSQQRLTSNQEHRIGTVYCGSIKQKIPIRTWIATRRALEGPENYNQDGLCYGIFTVHVQVTTESGQKSSKHFMIKVTDDWKELSAEMTECYCVNH